MTVVEPERASQVRGYVRDRVTISCRFTATNLATGQLLVLGTSIPETAREAMDFFQWAVEYIATQMTTQAARDEAQAWLDNSERQVLVLQGLRQHQARSFETVEDGYLLQVSGTPRTTRVMRTLVTTRGVVPGV
ncbi:hypothetical protein [Streptomyces tubercidicus]|uniref:hypothetical protein n=1 Tax=Streptomyces tubercidicus TaxID=47759 RepID=UPI00368F1996